MLWRWRKQHTAFTEDQRSWCVLIQGSYMHSWWITLFPIWYVIISVRCIPREHNQGTSISQPSISFRQRSAYWNIVSLLQAFLKPNMELPAEEISWERKWLWTRRNMQRKSIPSIAASASYRSIHMYLTLFCSTMFPCSFLRLGACCLVSELFCNFTTDLFHIQQFVSCSYRQGLFLLRDQGKPREAKPHEEGET